MTQFNEMTLDNREDWDDMFETMSAYLEGSISFDWPDVDAATIALPLTNIKYVGTEEAEHLYLHIPTGRKISIHCGTANGQDFFWHVQWQDGQGYWDDAYNADFLTALQTAIATMNTHAN